MTHAFYPPAGEAKVVLFDFGGVLTTSVIESFKNFSERVSGDSRLLLRILMEEPAAKKALTDHEEGRIEHEDFERIVAQSLTAAGAPIEADGLIAGMQAELHPDPEMLKVVEALKVAGIPVALVSNSLGRDCYQGYDLDELFDVQVISGIEGVRKPSRRLYEIACERLGVNPDNAIMIDDLAQNIDAARRLGMGGIVHTDVATTSAALLELLPAAPADLFVPIASR